MSLVVKSMSNFVLMLVVVPLLLPLYLVFRLLRLIKGTISKENVAGKVVLITGASSGIGEHVAYEYAKRGARLALAARREGRLESVAKKSLNLGSPDVIVVRTDVSRIEDCKRFIEEALKHFGRVDHLINNAGTAQTCMFEDSSNDSDSASIMDINFWGSVYCTRFAIPYLKKSKGKIVGIASVAAWTPTPKMSYYNASKAALLSFYETLRIELGSSIGTTIVTPGLIQSEIVTPDFISEIGVESVPIESTEVCAKAIVESACRGDFYLTVPSDARVLFWFKMLYPEFLDWIFRWQLLNKNTVNSKEE